MPTNYSFLRWCCVLLVQLIATSMITDRCKTDATKYMQLLNVKILNTLYKISGMESLAGDGWFSVGELMHNSRNIKEYAGDCISNFFNKYFLICQMYFLTPFSYLFPLYFFQLWFHILAGFVHHIIFLASVFFKNYFPVLFLFVGQCGEWSDHSAWWKFSIN